MSERERIVAGIMSGTSVDGIDVAVVRIGPAAATTFLGGGEQAFEPQLRADILACAEPGGGSGRLIAGLHFRLAHAYAHAVATTLKQANIDPAALDLIGCHGQTIAHWPNDAVPATLQAGSGPALAALAGVPVVHDFRSADVALGGQGAPLIPWVDWRLFGDAARTRSIGILNLGGIANITLLPQGIAEPTDLLAFDTGPANMVIDGLAQELYGEPRDHDGWAAASGRVDQQLLARLLEHEYFARPLPRSAGREEFGAGFVASVLAQAKDRELSPTDTLATATALTAESIARALASVPACWKPDEIVLGGGGASNPTLVEMLAERLPDVVIARHEDHGWPGGLKEALSFALLADAAVRGEPTALPNVTGVREPLVLGSLAPGRPPKVWPDWIASR